MNRPVKELKQLSRSALLGQYGLMILAYILIGLIPTILSKPFDGPFNNISLAIATGATYVPDTSLYVSIAATIVIGLASTILYGGLAKLHLAVARQEQLSFGMIFSQFKRRPDRFIVFTILMVLIGIGCIIPAILSMIILSVTGISDAMVLAISTVLSIAGCIFTLYLSIRFSMTVYVLVDQPETGAVGAMKESFHMMKGRVGKMIYLYFSFLPMGLLTLLSFGLAGLWVQPYVDNTIAWFYLDASGEIDRKIEEARRLEEEMGPVMM